MTQTTTAKFPECATCWRNSGLSNHCDDCVKPEGDKLPFYYVKDSGGLIKEEREEANKVNEQAQEKVNTLTGKKINYIIFDEVEEEENQAKEKSDGSTANYYVLPEAAEQLQDLIAFKNMNAQLGEIFRAAYRYGQCSHSNRERELNKIIFYAEAELNRLARYELNKATPKKATQPTTAIPAKQPVAFTLNEGGSWIKWINIMEPLIPTAEIPSMKNYAAVKFSDGSVYDYILSDWRK
jgi:hypothetical protein